MFYKRPKIINDLLSVLIVADDLRYIVVRLHIRVTVLVWETDFDRVILIGSSVFSFHGLSREIILLELAVSSQLRNYLETSKLSFLTLISISLPKTSCLNHHEPAGFEQRTDQVRYTRARRHRVEVSCPP
jgi:hypothetical protein